MVNHFSSGMARLDWLLWQIGLRLEVNVSIDTDEDIESLLVSTSLLRLAHHHGRAVNVLLHEGLSESVPPLERAIYEIWTDFRHLIDSIDRRDAARCMMINASMEFARFVFQQRSSFSPESVRKCCATLRSYRDDYPEAYNRIRKQRSTRKFHWSGLSRSALLKKVSKDKDNVYYKFLSWDAHAELAPINGIRFSDNEDGSVTVNFEPPSDVELSEWQAYTVGGMLYTFWNEYAYVFKQDAILGTGEDSG